MVVKQLGREWARANAGGIGFGDTQYVVQIKRANT